METTSEVSNLSLFDNSEINRNVTNKANQFTPEWAIYVETAYLGFVVVLGVPANSLIILVQTKTAAKTSTDYFILLMGVIELLCSGVNAPLGMVLNFNGLWTKIASSQLCAVRMFVLYVVTTCSTCLLGAIAVDRYIQTCHPLNTIYGSTMAKKICALIGVFVVMCGSPNLLVITINDKMLCGTRSHFLSFKRTLDMALVVFTMVILIIICFAYSRIAMHIRKRQRQRMNKKSHDTTTKPQILCCSGIKRSQVAPQMADINDGVGVSKSHSLPMSEGIKSTCDSFCENTSTKQQSYTSGPAPSDDDTDIMRSLIKEKRVCSYIHYESMKIYNVCF